MEFLRIPRHTVTLILGFSATFVSTIASMPLLYKSCNHTKSLDQLSKKTLIFGVLAHGLWIAYAYAINDEPLFVCSCITCFIETTILLLKSIRNITNKKIKKAPTKHRKTQTDSCYLSNTKVLL